MKIIYRLLSAAILCLCASILQAQNIDSVGLQRSTNGTISFARVANVKITDAKSFLSTTLQTKSSDSFALKKSDTDGLGMIHLRYQQYYKGIKVENAEYMLHGRIDSVETMNGDFQIVNISSVKPALSEKEALTDALNYVNAKEYKWQDSASEKFIKLNTGNPNSTYYPKGQLVIERNYLQGGEKLSLSWKFSIFSLNPNNVQWIYVDANTGEIINTTPQMFDTNTPLTAQTMYSGTLSITGDSYSGGYRLRETRNGVNSETLNLQDTYNYGSAIDFTNFNTNFTSGGWTHFTQDQQALDAHWGAEKVLDFWKTVFNRNSLDGNGLRILSYVHAGTNWNNAQWASGSGNRFMQYGDGDGFTFRPLTSLDICAHEMGHGIDEFTANLTYSKESGALNEGFSDIWGASIEHWAAPNKQTWLIGEDVTITQTALRSMSSPKQFGQSDTYLGTNWYNQTGCIPTQGNDYCGVHTNSGVLNHWYYLLSQGGNGTNDLDHAYNIIGIGINEAQQIAWRTESYYLTSSANYATTRTESILAAQDLFGVGSCEEITVTNAWYAVGVGPAYSGNAGLSISGDASFCTTSNSYYIPNLPAGSSVSWSVTPLSIVTINSPNANQTTLTKTGNGTITLTATISIACTSNPIVISLSNIMVGLPNDIGLDVSAGMYDNLSDCGDGANFQVLYNAADNNQYSGTVFVTAANATSLSWTVAPWSSAQSWSWNESNNGHTVYVATKSANKEITLKATASNACGSIVKYYSFSTGACPLVLLSAPAPETYSISPNPAGYTFTVSGNADAENITTASFSRIGVYDAMGNLKKQTLFAAGTHKAQMSIAELPTGYYYVEISDGKTVQRKVLMVKR